MTSKIKIALQIIAIIIMGITFLMTGTSFITSDGYPFMGQNNEMIDSQTYISDEFIYSFDDIDDFANRSIKLIEKKIISLKTPKYWPSSSIVLEKDEGIYQEFHLYDENDKSLGIARNDSSNQISISNCRKINPTVTKTTTIKEILNEEDLPLFFTLIQVDNDSFQLSIKNYGNYDIKEVTITYGFIDQLNMRFDGYSHGYYKDWKRYSIQEGNSIDTGFIKNKSIDIHIRNLKAGGSKLYSITKNDN